MIKRATRELSLDYEKQKERADGKTFLKKLWLKFSHKHENRYGYLGK